ncbi:alpha/beta fold hydrolase [Undibacterium sp. SXout7W]|uniref:alpha/beta fold hydrolase n=1 Tax=Undibacterium sp. SXout7W TaxID=3413049 RepID=UPI003BEF5678
MSQLWQDGLMVDLLLPAFPPHIVLIPGFMCDANLWQALLPALRPYAEIHYGNLNQGDSIDQMAEHIIARLPGPSLIIGFSLGGYVARRIAFTAPEFVAGLALLNTSARASTPEELLRNQQQIRMVQHYPYKGQTRSALRRALDPDHQDNEVLLAQLQAMSLTLGKDIFLRQLALHRADGHAELAHIHCPAIMVANRKDQMRQPDEAEKLAAGLSRGELRIIEQGGHMSPLEQPAELAAILFAWMQKYWTMPIATTSTHR